MYAALYMHSMHHSLTWVTLSCWCSSLKAQATSTWLRRCSLEGWSLLGVRVAWAFRLMIFGMNGHCLLCSRYLSSCQANLMMLMPRSHWAWALLLVGTTEPVPGLGKVFVQLESLNVFSLMPDDVTAPNPGDACLCCLRWTGPDRSRVPWAGPGDATVRAGLSCQWFGSIYVATLTLKIIWYWLGTMVFQVLEQVIQVVLMPWPCDSNQFSAIAHW